MTSVLVFIFGAVIGSVLNIFIYGLPHNQFISPFFCPYCKNSLKWYKNIPILGLFFIKGHCNHCKRPLSWQIPLVETLTALFTLGVYLKYALCFVLFVYLILGYSLITIAFIDLRWKIIPDVITLPGIFLGIFASFLLPEITFKEAALGAALGGGGLYLFALGYHILTKREGMGGGDIKLLAMIGAFLGWKAILPVIFLASLFGTVIGLTIMIWKKKDRYLAIPFGPFLSLGTLIILFKPHLFPW